MKDKILEILEGGIELEPEENYHTFNDNRVASEIADMVQKFVEWKDNNWVEYNKIEKEYYYHYSHSGFYHFKTINDLFTYWHKNIYKSTDK